MDKEKQPVKETQPVFEGFTQETGDFFWELCFHNERPWFQEHKETFERVLNIPFKALAAETFALVQQEADPLRELDMHVSRIYRDARRLFGRGPYRDNLWFTLHDRQGERASLYFEITPRGWGYGLGYWEPRAEQMEEYRRRIAANPAAFERIVKRTASAEYVLCGEPYKRPKGDFGPVVNPWYNRKWISLSCEREFGGELFSPTLPQLLAGSFVRLMPLYRFLNDRSNG